MGRNRRVMPFLQRRNSAWYFRFRLPHRLRSIGCRTELRVSLGTHELAIARERAERVLPDVYRLKHLARHMSALEPCHVQKALDLAFTRIVTELERTREPWLRHRAGALRGAGHAVSVQLNGGFQPRGRGRTLGHSTLWSLAGHRSERLRRGVVSARALLNQIDAPIDEHSPLFRQLALELLKLEAMRLEAQKARMGGDFRKEEEFIEYYHRRGYRAAMPVLAPAGPRLSEAWREYAREKCSALPKPQWSEKTAAFQEATFSGFLEMGVTQKRRWR
jgi:hypothetical protein